jgi:hypothetical protein
MFADRRHCVTNGTDAFEITLDPVGLLGKALLGRRKSGVISVRQNKWVPEQRTSHFMQVSDVDERNVTIEAQYTEDGQLRIFSIKPVDLMQRCLNGKRAMTIDCRGSAKLQVAFENKNAMSGPGIKRSRSQPSESGADYDRIEFSRHGTLSFIRRPDYIFACRYPFISALRSSRTFPYLFAAMSVWVNSAVFFDASLILAEL